MREWRRWWPTKSQLCVEMTKIGNRQQKVHNWCRNIMNFYFAKFVKESKIGYLMAETHKNLSYKPKHSYPEFRKVKNWTRIKKILCTKYITFLFTCFLRTQNVFFANGTISHVNKFWYCWSEKLEIVPYATFWNTFSFTIFKQLFNFLAILKTKIIIKFGHSWQKI